MAQYMADIKTLSPTVIVKVSINAGPGAFYGEKYKVEKVSSFLSTMFAVKSLTLQ